MKILTTTLPGVLLLEADVYADERGQFAELFSAQRYADAGIGEPFVQDNWSYSRQGVLRGLHTQLKHPQGKLITVCHGHVWDVVVDIDPASPTYGQHVVVELRGWRSDTPANQAAQQLWVPPGYAHGFCVLSPEATVFYKCTQTYQPQDEAGVLWSDPQLGIAWPTRTPILSTRDRQWPALSDFRQCVQGRV